MPRSHILLLTALAMLAFAGNSLLCRLALAGTSIDAGTFTAVRIVSGALTLCYVASGRLLGYVEPHINSWDCLGGLAVALAAGARTNDYLGGTALSDGNRIVASTPALYDTLDAVLGRRGTDGRSSSTIGRPLNG